MWPLRSAPVPLGCWHDALPCQPDPRLAELCRRECSIHLFLSKHMGGFEHGCIWHPGIPALLPAAGTARWQARGKATARPGACCTENGHSDRLPSHIRNVLISFPPLQNINRFWNLRSCHETKPSVSWPAVIAACDQPLPIEVRSYTREDPGSAHICVEKWDLSLSL